MFGNRTHAHTHTRTHTQTPTHTHTHVWTVNLCFLILLDFVYASYKCVCMCDKNVHVFVSWYQHVCTRWLFAASLLCLAHHLGRHWHMPRRWSQRREVNLVHIHWKSTRCTLIGNPHTELIIALQHSYNTLQHSATLCNTLPHPATLATLCNTLQHPATPCNTLQHSATPAPLCNTLQHAPTHWKSKSTCFLHLFQGSQSVFSLTLLWGCTSKGNQTCSSRVAPSRIGFWSVIMRTLLSVIWNTAKCSLCGEIWLFESLFAVSL